ncbi:MAG: helix-turn-helix transcriptional regulator [Marinoscillum sp.]
MELLFSEVAPSEHLSSIIKTFFILKYQGANVRKDYLLPNGTPSFFLMKSKFGMRVRFHENGAVTKVSEGIHIGYNSTLIQLEHRQIHVVGASLYPVYLTLLFGVSPKKLMNSFMDVSHIKGLNPHKWSFKNDDFTDEQCIVNMERFISEKLQKNTFREDFDLMYRKLTEPDGYRLTVGDLAEMLDYSQRYLSTLFQKYLGTSPKQFLKLVRFNQALKLMDEMKADDGFSSIAYELGYHDQAHFIRDFKSICGKTPGELSSQPDSLAAKFRYYK